MNTSYLLLIALAASLVTILLGAFALIMALVRYGKQKGSSDPQAQIVARSKLITGIVSAVMLFVIGAVLTVWVLITFLK
jgi:hypothetical protein